MLIYQSILQEKKLSEDNVKDLSSDLQVPRLDVDFLIADSYIRISQKVCTLLTVDCFLPRQLYSLFAESDG